MDKLPEDVIKRVTSFLPVPTQRLLNKSGRTAHPVDFPDKEWTAHLQFLCKPRISLLIPLKEHRDKYCRNPKRTVNGQCPADTLTYLKKLLKDGLDPTWALNEFLKYAPIAYKTFWDWNEDDGDLGVADIFIELVKKSRMAKTFDKNVLIKNIFAIDTVTPKIYKHIETYIVRAYILYVAYRKRYISKAFLNQYTTSVINMPWDNLIPIPWNLGEKQYKSYRHPVQHVYLGVLKDAFEEYLHVIDFIKNRTYARGQNTASISREEREFSPIS